MSEAVSDTGPILHLSEIDRLDALGIFDRLHVPVGVAAELERLGLEPIELLAGVVQVGRAPASEVDEPPGPHEEALQAADREVLTLARRSRYRHPVLTDDLALRRQIEHEGGVAVGSVGVLVRCFRLGRSDRDRLEDSLDRLMTRSTLHMSRAFRGYVARLLEELLRS